MARPPRSRTKRAATPRPARTRHALGAVGGRASADDTRRSLCASVFADPARVTDARTHGLTGVFTIEPHHHADLLQLDVLVGCVGEVTHGESVTRVQGTTLIVTPPHERHGYALRAGTPDAAVWLVKLRVGRQAATHDAVAGAFPRLLTGLDEAPRVEPAIAQFVQGWTPDGVGSRALVSLAAALCDWPGSATVSVSVGEPSGALPAPGAVARTVLADGGEGEDTAFRRSVEALSARVTDPPSLPEMAGAVGLSSRHFTRRFREVFGTTPLTYLAARRLDAARGLLRDEDRPVADVAAALGFSSPAAFSRWFTRLAGQSPRAFRTDPHHF